jgi:cell division protein FtsW
MTTGTHPRVPAGERRAPGAPVRHERPPRFRGPAWLDGPMTSCHLVLGAGGLLLVIGLVMVFSASSIEAALADEPAWAPGVKQLVLACIGVGAMVVAMRLPVGLVRRWSPIALLVVLGLLLLVLIPGIGQERNGARQWISLGVTDFQPSELAKLVFALWGAHILALRERYLTTKSLLVPVLPVFGVLSLLLVLIPGIGQERNGARQWISLGVTDFQPSELAKLVFALWGAHILALRERYLTTKSLLVPVLPVFGVLSLLLIAEPDFGAVVTLGLVLVGLLWAGGMPVRWFGLVAVAGAVLLAVVALVSPERMERLTSFLDPFADASDGGFQAVRGFYALANGGLSGVGLGNSAMKWNLLPEAESDYIFAIIGEELGFLGCLVVVALYGVLAYAGFRIARRSADRFVQLASVAITVWLIGQAAMNMGYVVGLLPVTGVTLPLISAGGTSLVQTLFIVGLLARFARSEPAAIEAQRARVRGPLARLLLPVPSAAVEPVRPRRRPEAAPRGRSAGSAGRTLVHTRGEGRPVPNRSGPADAPGAPRRAAAPRERLAAHGNRRGAEPPVRGGRRQPAAPGTGRRPGGPR